MLSRRQLLAAGALAPALLSPSLLWADDKPNIPITGTSDSKYALLDELMALVIVKPKLPGGATLAVAKDGKIVYDRGFGYSDQNTKSEMKQSALFRISSISKPFTAVSVLQLVEKGKLKLDDKVTTILGLRPGGGRPDARWHKITIRHLLEHRGGWDHTTKAKGKVEPTFDSLAVAKEMGVRSPAMPPAIIQYVLRRPLDFDPGEKFSYSNFGYLLLGRVVEKLGGSKTYADYVKKHVLDPLKLDSIRQGKTLTAAPGEVKYYSNKKGLAVMGPALGKPVPAPYGGFCLESMDSHSAWISSAADLLRFLVHFEDPKKCKLLEADTVETMFARPEGEDKEKPSYYAKGFLTLPQKEGRNYWHDGVMEGTSALAVRRADGIAFAVLFNTRQEVDKTDPVNALEPHLHKVLTAVFAAKK